MGYEEESEPDAETDKDEIHNKLIERPGAQETHDLYIQYVRKVEANRFLSETEATKDVLRHFAKVTRRYKAGSENYLKVSFNSPFRYHYKMRTTYVFGEFQQTSRREYAHAILLVNYIKGSRGTIYYAMSARKTLLSIYSAHVFDRFTQRVTNRDFNGEDSRTEAILEIIRRMDAVAKNNPASSMPLIDKETNSAYLPVEDGYLVGHLSMYGTQDNSREVVYYKTFLSHYEVSDQRMDLLLKLNRERKEMLAARAQDRKPVT